VEVQRFTFDDLKNVLVNRIGIAEARVTDDLDATFEDMGLDSLAMVELQLAIQQRYGIEIIDDETSHIKTPRGAIDFTNRRLSQ